MLDASHENPAPSAASLQGVQEDRQAHVSYLSGNFLIPISMVWARFYGCVQPVKNLFLLKTLDIIWV